MQGAFRPTDRHAKDTLLTINILSLHTSETCIRSNAENMQRTGKDNGFFTKFVTEYTES